MATQLFLGPCSVATDTTPPGNLSTDVDLALQTTRGSGVVSSVVNTVAGPTSGVQFSATPRSYWYRVNAVTVSGAITKNLWGFESAMAANAGFQVLIERYDGSAVFVSTVQNSEFGTELGTGVSANNWATGTVTSTSFANGDYIRLRIYINDAGGNMASGNTATLNTFGTTADANGDSYITFTETITAYTPPSYVPRAPGVDSGNAHFSKAWQAIRHWRHGESGILLPDISFVH